MNSLERELTLRDLQHEMELSQLEHKLEEYFDLKSEAQIRRERDLYRVLKSLKLMGLEKWGYKEPPAMRRIMPRATTDWDFQNAYWTLSTAQYVSSPSSLLLTDQCIVLCKYSGTYPLDQGRIVTQIRVPTTSSYYYVGSYAFRQNRAAGSAPSSADEHYELRERSSTHITYDATRACLVYWTGGSWYTQAAELYLANGAPPANTWDQRRVTWWVSGGLLIVRLERYYGGAWIKAINDILDANNRFTGNPNRREGPGWCSRNCYFDDTEIWGP